MAEAHRSGTWDLEGREEEPQSAGFELYVLTPGSQPHSHVPPTSEALGYLKNFK
jgi:hypothetical protein